MKNNKLKFEYILTRKKVKNINCRIKKDGKVYVSASPEVTIDRIESFLLDNQELIIDKIKKLSQKFALEIEDNKQIHIMGKYYTLKIIESDVNSIEIKDNIFYVNTEDVENMSYIEFMLDYYAKEQVERTCNDMSNLIYNELKTNFNIIMPKIKYRKMKSMWGNCNCTKGSITFSTNLVYTDFEFIKYIVLHEFVHLIHANHQKEFYDVVKIYMPNYKEIEKRY